MRYWLSTYYPYCRFKKVYDTRDEAILALKDIVRRSLRFWKRVGMFDKKPFDELDWTEKYIHNKDYAPFSLVAIKMPEKSVDKWFKSYMEVFQPYQDV